METDLVYVHTPFCDNLFPREEKILIKNEELEIESFLGMISFCESGICRIAGETLIMIEGCGIFTPTSKKYLL